MKRLSNLSLGIRLGSAFGLIVGLLLVVAAVGLSSGSTQGAAAQKLSSNLRLSQEVMQVKFRDADFNGWQTAYAFDITRGVKGATSHNAASRAAFLDSAASFRRELAVVQHEHLNPAQRALARTALVAFDQFMATDNQVIALYRSGATGAAAQASALVLGREITNYTTISKAVDSLAASVARAARQASASASSAQSTSRTTIILISGIAVLLAAAAAFLVIRYIKRNVHFIVDRMSVIQTAFKTHLMAALHQLAGGDLTIRLKATTSAGATEFSKDELGQIRAQVEEFRGGLLDCYEAYNQTAENLGRLIGEVTRTAGSVGAASQEMSSSSEETGKATGEIAHAIGDVAHGAERQVTMVETTRRAADEVADAVRESAEQAEQTAEAAAQAREAALHGVEAAEQANEAMRSVRDSSSEVTQAISELAAKSEQIGEIVSTITGIAEQTNLLALNAAIEAARAGDQGRGFAVVADEVRKLAEESQQAAREISGLISAIQDGTVKAVSVVEAGAKQTADGAAVVEQTREAFLTIGKAVEDMTARIEQIAAGSQQITASAASMQDGMAEIESVAEQSSASTQEVSASTEETSASAEQIAASAQQLAGNAEQLNTLVAQFKTTT